MRIREVVQCQPEHRPENAGEGRRGLVDAEDLALLRRGASARNQGLGRRRQEREPYHRSCQRREQQGQKASAGCRHTSGDKARGPQHGTGAEG